MKYKKWLKLISLPVFPITCVIYYYFLKLNIVHAGSFYFRVFPLPLTFIVFVLQTAYLILSGAITIGALRGKLRKELMKLVVYMLSVALLYTILFSLKIAYGVLLTPHDVVISTAMLLLPLCYNALITRKRLKS